jgi:hypothetical protein
VPVADHDELVAAMQAAAGRVADPTTRVARARQIADCTPARFAQDLASAAALALDAVPSGSQPEREPRDVILAEKRAWDDAALAALGPGAELLAVSRWIPDSRAYGTDDRVALIRHKYPARRATVSPFVQEAEIWQRLGIEAESIEAEPWEALLLPRFDGTPLNQRHDLSLSGRVRVLRKVAAAAARLHSAGVGHRDLRPDNVLVRENGDVQIIDYDRAIVGDRADVAAVDWVGASRRGVAANPFWKLAILTLAPRAESLARRARTVLLRRGSQWSPPDVQDEDLAVLARAWKLAERSDANAPGQSLAYYALTYRGWHFPGERPWYLRWHAIHRSVDFAGKSVIELGCNMGLLSTFATLHGARSATGVDGDPLIVDTARLVARALGSPAQFDVVDLIRDDDWEEQLQGADVAVAMSLVHWLPDPDRVLRFLARHREVIYEGHDSLEVETERLRTIGFDSVSVIQETERGRYVLHGHRS